jgi:uncharacterized protein
MRLPLLLECDRCLDSFTHTLAEEFEVFFELVVVDEEKAGVVSEYFYQSNVPDVVFLNEPVVDVYSVLAEQLYLGLPEKSLCSDNCLGLCPECGANLNRGPCDCSRGAAASPFSVLMRLKEQ